jgi:RHS repeat-associated protein
LDEIACRRKDTAGQLIEEDASFSNAGTANEYVWGIGYVNDLVERDQYMDVNNNLITHNRLWAEQDANHNVTSVVDDNGGVAERFIYEPYGQVTLLNSNWTLQTSGGSPVTAGNDTYGWTTLFQGERFDVVSGLYQDGARWYRAQLGRFLQQDPAGYVMMSPR